MSANRYRKWCPVIKTLIGNQYIVIIPCTVPINLLINLSGNQYTKTRPLIDHIIQPTFALRGTTVFLRCLRMYVALTVEPTVGSTLSFFLFLLSFFKVRFFFICLSIIDLLCRMTGRTWIIIILNQNNFPRQKSSSILLSGSISPTSAQSEKKIDSL